MADDHRSTRQLLEKISSVPCRYRHKLNATYYGAKKVAGKRKEHSLGTTDRKPAERFLKKWITDIEKVDGHAGKTTLAVLLHNFTAVNQGKSSKTQATNAAIINVFKKTWKPGLDARITDIKPSDRDEWLAQHEARLKHTTYNRYCG